jgi:ribose-phosphate pyrophosphokinase
MPDHECMIIANPEGNAWDFAVSVYNNIKEKNSGQNDKKYYMNELKIKRFRDGEIKVKVRDNIRRKNCFLIHDSSLCPSEWLIHLAFANQAMRNSSADEIIDVLPYMKFTRQDRKDESRVSINSKVVTDIVELYADRILTIDSHFTQIQGFYSKPLDNLYSSKILLEHLKERHPSFLENLVVMSPDVGGTKRADAFKDRLGIRDIAIGHKHRPEEGEIDDFRVIGEVSGKNVLIVDDIVDSGNTLIIAAKELKKNDAKDVYAYCTHGIFSENARERVTQELDLMITTDSIYQPKHEKIEVIPLAGLFAEAIYRTNRGDSLSALFE